jgi:uracil-DNA glycosylase
MACRGWLEAELAVVGPRVTVAMGAGQALEEIDALTPRERRRRVR